DLLVDVGCVVSHVNGGRGAIVLTHSVNRSRVGVNAFVFGPDLSSSSANAGIVAASDGVFRNRSILNEEKPVRISADEIHGDVCVQVIRGNDIEHCNLRYLVRVIQCESMSDTSATIMAGNGKPIESEMFHDFDLIQCHGPL